MTEYRFIQNPEVTISGRSLTYRRPNHETVTDISTGTINTLREAGLIEEVKSNITVEIPYRVADILANGYASDGERSPDYGSAQVTSVMLIKRAFRSQTAESRDNVGNELDEEG